MKEIQTKLFDEMILRRLGKKSKIAKDIISYFAEHTTYIEPFFGAGGVFFSKPLAKYNLLNDIDEEVFNLFQVVLHKKEELQKTLEIMPIHQSLLDFWRRNKEIDCVLKACRFLLLSNFTLYGKGETIKLSNQNTKDILLSKIQKTQEKIKNAVFSNRDFRDFLKSIVDTEKNFQNYFVYCDPPYLQATNNYSNSFSMKDFTDLLDLLLEKRWKFAVSEFENNFVLDEAKKRGLYVFSVVNRRNLKNRRTEILITNYLPNFLNFYGRL